MVVDAPQRSPEWFQARAGRVTASCAKHIGAFLKGGDDSAARRDYKMQLVCERLTGFPDEDGYTNDDMARGIALEPQALSAYEAQTGSLVGRVGFLSHTDLMAGGSPDGVIGDFEGLVECKAPRPANHVRYLRQGGIPKEHEAQLRHLLWLTGAAWIDFVSFCPLMPNDLKLYVERMKADEVTLKRHDGDVRAFLDEVQLEYDSLRGWSVLSEAK